MNRNVVYNTYVYGVFSYKMVYVCYSNGTEIISGIYIADVSCAMPQIKLVRSYSYGFYYTRSFL